MCALPKAPVTFPFPVPKTACETYIHTHTWLIHLMMDSPFSPFNSIGIGISILSVTLVYVWLHPKK